MKHHLFLYFCFLSIVWDSVTSIEFDISDEGSSSIYQQLSDLAQIT